MAEEMEQPVNPAEALRILSEKIKMENAIISRLREEVGKVIVGQQYMIDRLLIALLADGHVLLEGVPGLAKTLAIKTLAQAISVDFNRIQFTPDLLPADVTGTLIYNQKSEEFSIKRAPSLPISFWPMRSTVLLQRCNQLSWRQCRKDK